jgi:hypothetical protein
MKKCPKKKKTEISNDFDKRRGEREERKDYLRDVPRG